MAEQALASSLDEGKRSKGGSTVLSRFVKNKLAIAGVIILTLVVLMAICAPLLATHDYTKIDPTSANQFPSANHILGTDRYGRDLWSRLVYGARYSLMIGICAQALSVFFGIILGSFAGYFGGVVDNVILRCCDVFQAIPATLLAIVISQALGSGFIQTTFALAVGSTPMSVRMLRASMLSVREQEFVEAAKAIDCSSLRIMFYHVLPNSLSPIIITTSMGVGRMIMESSGLSYLGLGIQEPAAEWGAMLSLAKDTMRYYPYQVIVPGIAIALVILAFNLMGDGLRDALDPKLRS
jgi:peptide/nickel transport system permease protein